MSSLENAYLEAKSAIKSNNITKLSSIIKDHPHLLDYKGSNLNTLLIESILSEKKILVELLLNFGADINLTSKANESPLMIAAYKKLFDITDLLIQKGANVDYVGVYGWTALHTAIEGNSTSIAILLIKAKANPNIPDHNNRSPLEKSLNAKNYVIAEDLIKHNADLNVKLSNNNAILLEFVEKGRSDLAELVLKKLELQADLLARNIKSKNLYGNTALILSAYKGYDNIVTELIRLGAPLNLTGEDGSTALHAAIIGNNVNLAIKIIEAGSDIEIKDNFGKTPLDRVMSEIKTRNGQIDIFKALITHGLDVNTKTSQNGYLINYIIRNGYDEILDLVLSKKTDLNVKEDLSGLTPLHYTLKKGLISYALKLIEAEADVNVKDSDGETPLNYCYKYVSINSEPQIIEAMINHGLSKDAMVNKKFYLIHYAAIRGYENIVNALIEKDFDLLVKAVPSGNCAFEFAYINNNFVIGNLLLGKMNNYISTIKSAEAKLYNAILTGNETEVLNILSKTNVDPKSSFTIPVSPLTLVEYMNINSFAGNRSFYTKLLNTLEEISYPHMFNQPDDIKAIIVRESWKIPISNQTTIVKYSLNGAEYLKTPLLDSHDFTEPLDGFTSKMVRESLEYYSSILKGIKFEESSEQSANLYFGYSSKINLAGAHTAAIILENDGYLNSSSITLNKKYFQSLTTSFCYKIKTILHEVGHSLGLQHPYGSNSEEEMALYPLTKTIMSYSKVGLEKYLDHNQLEYYYVEATTPLYNDLIALDAIYGLNASYQAGDNIYDIDSSVYQLHSILDMGGTDTLVLEGTEQKLEINLNEGILNTVGKNRFYIGPKTVIENITGGKGQHIIVDNDTDNIIDLRRSETSSTVKLIYKGNDKLYLNDKDNTVVINKNSGIKTIYCPNPNILKIYYGDIRATYKKISIDNLDYIEGTIINIISNEANLGIVCNDTNCTMTMGDLINNDLND